MLFGWLNGFLFDLRLGLRGLGRDRAFSLTAVVTLSMALALNVVVFTVRDAMLFRGMPMAERSDRLAYVALRRPSDLACCPGPVRYDDFERWRQQARSFEDLSLWRGSDPITFRYGNGRPIDMTVSRRTANSFSVLGVQPLLGRDFTAADEVPGAPPVALVSYQFWQRRLGQRDDIVGSTAHVNGVATTIIGVMPPGFVPLYEQDLWTPLPRDPAIEGSVIGRLRDGVTFEEARAELDAITRALQAAEPSVIRGVPAVRNYSQAHVAPDAPAIYGSLWAGAWFVLLIACANLANLTLVRTLGRSREFATRIALGAGQSRMVRQLLVESFAVTGIAAVTAWWITNWSVKTWAEATSSRYLALDYSVDHRTFTYLLAVAFAAALLIAIVPIAKVLRLGADGALKGEARGLTHGARGKRLTTALVAGQMALAIVLLLGAGVLVRSFENIVGAATGVREPESIVVTSLRLPSDTYPSPASRTRYFEKLDAQLKTVAGVDEVSFANVIPTRNTTARPFEIEGRAPFVDGGELTQFLAVGASYFRVMGGAMAAGREFSGHDAAAAPLVVIVNQAFADLFWPGEDPLGKRLRSVDRNLPGAWRTIVGVAPNIMQGEPTRQRFRPVVYVPFAQQPGARAFFFMRTSVPPHQLLPAARESVLRLDRDIAAEEFMSLKSAMAFDRDTMDLEHADLGKHAAVAPILAGIALAIAAIGLFAMVAHSVSQRTKEIGVRMAIGAATGDIARMILREGMRPVAIGLGAGILASMAANRVLESQLVGVSPYDPVTMAVGPLVLVGVALIGCRIPARRATRVDPVVALRHD